MKYCTLLSCIICFYIMMGVYAHAQTDSTDKGKMWAAYFNDYDNNPAVTACYNKYNLNVNRQQSFMGKYSTGHEYNARVHCKLKRHGGFSIIYQHKTYGLFTRQATGLAYNYRIKIGRNGMLSAAFGAGATAVKYNWQHVTLPDMVVPDSGIVRPTRQQATGELMVPDFNAGLMYVNRNLIAECFSCHLTEPNIAFYKTPGSASNLSRVYTGRLNYVVSVVNTGPGLTLIPGISFRGERGGYSFFTGLLTVRYGCAVASFEYRPGNLWETRLTVLALKSNTDASQLRVNMNYRRYTSMTQDFGVETGEFRFGVNYSFGAWKK